jgi:hypothetical protein
MKIVAILVLLAMALAVYGCGTGTPTTTVETTTNGNWEAQLTGGLGQASELNFVTQFTVTNVNGVAEPLYITGFGFINAGQCFSNALNATTEIGAATITVLSSHQVQGTMTLTITSVTPSGNVLALDGTNVYGTASGAPGTIGTLSNGVVTGTWTLTGPCTNGANPAPSGDFIMCQGAATCTIP